MYLLQYGSSVGPDFSGPNQPSGNGIEFAVYQAQSIKKNRWIAAVAFVGVTGVPAWQAF